MILQCYHPFHGCHRLIQYLNDSCPLTDTSSKNRYRYAVFHAKRGRCIYYKKCPIAIRIFNNRSLFDEV